MNYLKILETRMREIEEQIMRESEDDPCAGPPRPWPLAGPTY